MDYLQIIAYQLLMLAGVFLCYKNLSLSRRLLTMAIGFGTLSAIQLVNLWIGRWFVFSLTDSMSSMEAYRLTSLLFGLTGWGLIVGGLAGTLREVRERLARAEQRRSTGTASRRQAEAARVEASIRVEEKQYTEPTVVTAAPEVSLKQGV